MANRKEPAIHSEKEKDKEEEEEKEEKQMMTNEEIHLAQFE